MIRLHSWSNVEVVMTLEKVQVSTISICVRSDINREMWIGAKYQRNRICRGLLFSESFSISSTRIVPTTPSRVTSSVIVKSASHLNGYTERCSGTCVPKTSLSRTRRWACCAFSSSFLSIWLIDIRWVVSVKRWKIVIYVLFLGRWVWSRDLSIRWCVFRSFPLFFVLELKITVFPWMQYGTCEKSAVFLVA